MQLIRFTIFAAFVGLSVGYIIFSTPIYLTLRTALDDCGRQATAAGCLESKTAGCMWLSVAQVKSDAPSFSIPSFVPNTNSSTNSTNFMCVFSDFTTVDCSKYNNDSDACARFNDQKSCAYRYTTKTCYHKAGLDSVDTGTFSCLTVAGGAVGPFLLSKFNLRFGNFATLLLMGFFALLSAILFAIGIENGNLGLWASSKIFSSAVGFSGAALFPEIMAKQTDLKNISLHQRGMLIRLLGLFIGVAAFVTALFLYGDTPRDIFFANPVFNVRLQNFNLAQWFMAVGYLLFALSVKYPEWFDTNICCCCNHNEHDQNKNADDDQVHGASTTTDNSDVSIKTADAPPPTIANDEEELAEVPEERICIDENSLEKVERIPDEEHKKESESHDPHHEGDEPAIIIAAKNTTDSENENDEVEDAQAAKRYLQLAAGILIASNQQLVGIGVVASYVPVILQDLIADPLLAQLFFASGLLVGAILSAALLSHFFAPIKIFVSGGFICALSTLLIGIALMPGVVENSQSSSNLALFGLVLFSTSFGAAGSSLFVASLADTFKIPGTLPTGMGISTCVSVLIQVILRLVFPIFVANINPDARIGRAIAFFSFAVLGFVTATALVVVRCFL